MSPVAQTLRLQIHPAQARFLDSQALFRGFTGGRGAGKTWIGAYDLLKRAQPRRLYMAVAPTYPMLKDASWRTFLALGEQLRFVRQVNHSDLRVTLGNGAEVLFRSADDPERLRGPNLSGVWLDEASLMVLAAFEVVIACLRESGQMGWLSATFTPKGRLHWTFQVFGGSRPDTELMQAATWDNPFLPPQFADTIAQQYPSFLALQELGGQFVGDRPGALWKREALDLYRVRTAPPLARVVVAIDPAVTSGEDSDETGIVVAGLGLDGHGYVLDDLSLRGSPAEWARTAVAVYRTRQADRIIGEVNNGGEMVGYTLATIDPTVSYKAVHASRGKQTRAEPIAALFEQGRVHMVGAFPDLEDQLCTWLQTDPKSPDRLDSLVWSLTELFLEPPEDSMVEYSDHVSISRY